MTFGSEPSLAFITTEPQADRLGLTRTGEENPAPWAGSRR